MASNSTGTSASFLYRCVRGLTIQMRRAQVLAAPEGRPAPQAVYLHNLDFFRGGRSCSRRCGDRVRDGLKLRLQPPSAQASSREDGADGS